MAAGARSLSGRVRVSSMLTDLRLQKYLQGLLSEAEAREMEALVEKSPELKARLEALRGQSEVIGKPMWQRLHLEKKSRRGSRVRSTIMLPMLLLVAVVVMLSGHWFSRPGENSTFTLSGGTGHALEILYNAESGWRYLDTDFRGGDSLTFSVRDSGSYQVAVMAVFGKGKEAEVVPIWKAPEGTRYDKHSPKPIFPSGDAAHPMRPTQIAVFYSEAALPELSAQRVAEILETNGNERGGLEFKYQVFTSGI